MHRRRLRWFYIIITGVVFALVLGCTQPEDVVAPVSATNIVLYPALLPSLPAGYCYELWAIDTNEATYPIGKFFWNSDLYRFYDTAMNRIDSVWTFGYDLLDPLFQYLAVSVEEYPDIEPDSIGPIMLRDTIVDPVQSPMILGFPIGYGLATAGFSMQTPTDRNSDSYEAGGIWFAYYSYPRITIYDSITAQLLIPPSLVRDRILDTATSYWVCDVYEGIVCVESTDVTSLVRIDPGYKYDWASLDTLNDLDSLAKVLDTMAIACTTTVVDSPYFLDQAGIVDTFSHTYMEFRFIAFPVNVGSDSIVYDSVINCCDTCAPETVHVAVYPFKDYIHSVVYTVDSNSNPDSARKKMDRLLPYYEEVPDLDDTKWHYKGWVISPYLPSDCPDLARLTKPAWLPATVDWLFGDPDNWPIVSTGKFKSFDGPDYDENLYSENRRVPQLPGEDFIRNLPCLASDFYFADSASRRRSVRTGEAFVTIEPDNYDENTNFPIVLFSTRWHLPSYNMVSDTMANHDQSGPDFDLVNRSGQVPGNTSGFPTIKAIIKPE
jgi:hypothetical protein